MRDRHRLLAPLLAPLLMVAACGGHALNIVEGSGGSSDESRGGGAPILGVAGKGEGGSGNGGTTTGTAGAAGTNQCGRANSAGAAGASAGRLRDYLGDPNYPDSFWQAESFAQSKMDPTPLEQALCFIENSGWEIHSFLIAKRGRLVFERYGWNPGTHYFYASTPHQTLPTERQPQVDATESFLSALVGVALSEGMFSSIQVHAADSFPDYDLLEPSAEKSSITLDDLLTMRSGLAYREELEGLEATFVAPDPARAMFRRSVVDKPVGTVWNDSGGGANIVAEMLRVATGKTPLEYANDKLFGPIGIDSPIWYTGMSGTNWGGYGLLLSAREMARFGELFRSSGTWQGKSVVPSDWIEMSTAAHCNTTLGDQYGYFWWVPNLDGFFSAYGAYGQAIYVNRQRGLVIVFTGALDRMVARKNLEQLIRDYVLPAQLD